MFAFFKVSGTCPFMNIYIFFSKMYACWFADKLNYAKMKKYLFGEVIDQGTF